MTATRLLHEDEEIHQRRWVVLGAMCLILVLVVMSVSGLNVALPALQADLGASQTALQWIVDSYALVFAGLLLTAGAIGDRFGRKLALLGGLALFAVGALIGGIATTSAQVIAGRVVMGVGAAFIMPATLSIITVVFPPQERSRAIAIWAGFAGAGGAIGPIVSGALLEGFWWGSVLLVNLPVIAAVAVAVVVFAPRTRDDEARRLDPLGAVLSLVGISALVFGIIEGPEQGWADPVVVGAFVATAVLLGGFVSWERRHRHSMLPMSLFRDRRFSVGSGVITVVFSVMFGFFFLVAQYLQFVRGYSALYAGLATLPMAAAMVIFAPRSAGLAERFGLRAVVASGFGLIALGYGIFALTGSDTPYLQLAVAFFVVGAGIGCTTAPATGSIMSAVPLNRAGVGSAVNDTSRELGGALGIAVFGSLATSAYQASLDAGRLPPEAAAAAEDSVGAALGIAERIGGPQGAGFALEVGRSFTDAFTTAVGAAAVVAVLAAGVVLLVAPRRTPTRLPSPDAAGDAAPEGRTPAPVGRAEHAGVGGS
ncbi:MFS transporter [soil metagenome]